MTLIRLYLAAYLVLVLGAVLALWRSGILAELSPVWVALGLLFALGLGVVLAATTSRPAVTTRIE